MSWEDCGFKPGKINGPAKCPRQCSDCDGDHHFYIDSGDDAEDEAGTQFVCKHCGVNAEMVDDDTDADDFEDPTCEKCGSGDIEWVDCDECHGEGQHDLYDEDPVNYAEGEEYEQCETCSGKGGWTECHGCQRKAESDSKARIEAQTLPLFATPEAP